MRVVADLVISYSFIKPGSVNGKTVGLLGTLTSLIGIYQLWPSWFMEWYASYICYSIALF